MELHERMKRQALAEFESYRQRVEDLQLCTEAQVGPMTCVLYVLSMFECEEACAYTRKHLYVHKYSDVSLISL